MQCPWELNGPAQDALDARKTASPHLVEKCPVSEATYVDDHLGLVDADSPQECVEKARKLLDIVIRTFLECGLKPNLKAGKTEIALYLKGKNARKTLAELYVAEEKRHYIEVPDGSHRVRVVRRYKHLGTIRDVNGSNVPDARKKASACLQAYLPIAHRILGNQRIKLQTRHSLATSLCFSRLGSGTDTWLDPSDEAAKVVHGARQRVLRQVAGMCRFAETGHGSDAEVIKRLGDIPTDLWLLRIRLRGLPALLTSGPRALLALRLQPGTSAAASLARDLRWAWQAAPELKARASSPALGCL